MGCADALSALLDRGPLEVLDRGWVELQDVMGDDLAIVNAARTSHLGESKGPVADKSLLFYLAEHRHTSPFEMAEMKIRVRAPVMVWWQWTRHRTFNFSAQSGRYMQLADEFYFPIEWRLQAKENKQASDGLLDLHNSERLSKMLLDDFSNSYDHYNQALALGVAKEQARLFLPGFAMYYTFVVKSDVRNWLHFFSLRNAPEAQYEIRQYAETLFTEFFEPLFPWTAEAFKRWPNHF